MGAGHNARQIGIFGMRSGKGAQMAEVGRLEIEGELEARRSDRRSRKARRAGDLRNCSMPQGAPRAVSPRCRGRHPASVRRLSRGSNPAGFFEHAGRARMPGARCS
jgi:hypothetical protein